MLAVMSTLGWTALGTLTTKVFAQAGTLTELFAYTTAAVAVCGGVAALMLLAEFDRIRIRP